MNGFTTPTSGVAPEYRLPSRWHQRATASASPEIQSRAARGNLATRCWTVISPDSPVGATSDRPAGRDYGSELQEIAGIGPDWNGMGSPCPNLRAIRDSERLLAELLVMDSPPQIIMPSGDGGVAFVWEIGKLYADIECLNDGECVACHGYGNERRTIWAVEPTANGYRAAAERIMDFLGG